MTIGTMTQSAFSCPCVQLSVLLSAWLGEIISVKHV